VVELTPSVSRSATDQSYQLLFTVRSWDINDTPQPKHEDYTQMYDRNTSPMLMRFYGSTFWNWGANSPFSSTPQGMWPDNFGRSTQAGTMIRRDTPLGSARLGVKIDLHAMQIKPGVSRMDSRDKPDRTLFLSVPIKIVDTPDEVVQGRTLTGAELEAFKKSLKLGSVMINVFKRSMGSDQPVYTQIGLSIEAGLPPSGPKQMGNTIPEGAAFDVKIEIEGETYSAGQLIATGDSTDRPSRSYWSSEDKELLQLPKATTANVRLIPNRELAQIDPRTTWFHNAEIVLHNVPIKINDHRQDKTTPLSEVRGTSMQERMTRQMPKPTTGNSQNKKSVDTEPERTPPEYQPTNP
jgi:hypothetical protein